MPAGYKLTEVGVIPEDWNAGPIASIADIYSGATPSTQNPANWNGSIRWCVPTDITSGTTKYLAETSRSITQKGLQGSGATLLPLGALLLCSRATIGEVKIAAKSLCTNQGFKSLVCKHDAYNEFLYYLLLTLKPRLKEKATGSTFLEIGKKDLASIQIALPSYPEQRAIAEALSDVDKLLESLDALIAKKRAIKQAAMQQLLTGQTRLPGYNEKWRTIRLGDLGQWRGGLTPLTTESRYWYGGTVPWMTSSDVRQGKLNDSSENITEQAIEETSIPVIRPNSVIIVIRSGILRRFLPVARNLIPIAINQDLRALEPGPLHRPQFLVHALMGFERSLLRFCLKSGTTVESIDSTWFLGFKLPIPTLNEQQAIATVLSDMDAEITALEQRRDKTRVIKQGMMQQLLTGRVRLV